MRRARDRCMHRSPWGWHAPPGHPFSAQPRSSPLITAPATPPPLRPSRPSRRRPPPRKGRRTIVWIARRPGPVKRLKVILWSPANIPVLRPSETDCSVTLVSLYSQPPASTSIVSPGPSWTSKHVALAVDPDDRVAVGRGERVDEEPRSAQQHVADALHPLVAVLHVRRSPRGSWCSRTFQRLPARQVQRDALAGPVAARRRCGRGRAPW